MAPSSLITGAVNLDAANLTGTMRACLAVSSGVLLGLSSLYPALFVLPWFGFLPLLIALSGLNAKAAYGLGMLAGLTFFIVCAYWMVDFVHLVKGYDSLGSVALAALYWLYSAQLMAVIACLTVVLGRRIPVLWVFPVVVTAVFAGFPSLFSVQVGETQSLFLAALQGTAITGVHGLDFVIALVNVLLVQSLTGKAVTEQAYGKNAQARGGFDGSILAYLLVFAWFGYGVIGLDYWERKTQSRESVKVGLVQPDQPPSTGDPQPWPGYTRAYSLPMALSEELVGQSVDVIVWPELRSQNYFSAPHVQASFHRHTQQWQTPLIFQETEKTRDDGSSAAYNRSVFLTGEGEFGGRYSKIKRIAFAEYLPVFGDWPEAKAMIRDFFGKFYDDISAGDGPQVFTVEGLSLIPLICYEVMFPQFVADAVPDDASASLLLGQSNNVWFGETRQPYQHLHASVLRSVESRLPLVHVVNNGPSAVVLPSGRMHFRSDYHQAAAYVVDVPVNRKGSGSFYSRHPGLFISGCYLSLALMLLWCWMPDKWRGRIAGSRDLWVSG